MDENLIALIQRVTCAAVVVAGATVGRIEKGLLAFIGVERGVGEQQAARLLERLLDYRVFADAEGRMHLSLREVDDGLLLVAQFTLAADTRTGTRASFTPAAGPAHGRALFDYLRRAAENQHPEVASGCFGADMQVSLSNDGPVTFWLTAPPATPKT